MMIQNGNLTSILTLGKGEVDSSILSSSTIFPNEINAQRWRPQSAPRRNGHERTVNAQVCACIFRASPVPPPPSGRSRRLRPETR